MYEACGEGFPEPTEYIRRMLHVTHEDGAASEAWTYVYNWPVTGLPQIASGSFWRATSAVPVASVQLPAPRARRPRARHSSIPRSRAASPTSSSNSVRMRGRVFEPGQEVEGLAEIAAVIELAGDRGQIFQAAGDVVRLVLKDLPPLFLRQLPPRRRFLDRDQRRAGRLGAAELGLHGRELFLLGALGIAHMAGDAGQPPGGRARAGSAARSTANATTDSAGVARQPCALDRRKPRHPPRPALAASENREHGAMEARNRARFKLSAVIPGRGAAGILRRCAGFVLASPRNDGGL